MHYLPISPHSDLRLNPRFNVIGHIYCLAVEIHQLVSYQEVLFRVVTEV